MAMTEITAEIRPYKVKIGFEQNTKGVISFNEYIHFDEDDLEKLTEYAEKLATMLVLVEARFKERGFKVSSDLEETKK